MIGFDEKQSLSWWNYEPQAVGNVSEGFPGVLEVTLPQHQPTKRNGIALILPIHVPEICYAKMAILEEDP